MTYLVLTGDRGGMLNFASEFLKDLQSLFGEDFTYHFKHRYLKGLEAI